MSSKKIKNKCETLYILFGKHKGTLLKDLDLDYVKYVVDNNIYLKNENEKYKEINEEIHNYLLDRLQNYKPKTYGDYVLKFGKYKDMSYNEVLKIDCDYIRYILDKNILISDDERYKDKNNKLIDFLKQQLQKKE